MTKQNESEGKRKMAKLRARTMSDRDRMRKIRALTRQSDGAVVQMVNAYRNAIEWETFARNCLDRAMLIAKEGKVLSEISPKLAQEPANAK